MKIGTVRVRNFRSIESLDLPLAPVTFVGGPNGSGKTSLQAALEFVVSGRASWTNDRGQGLDGLVRDGADLAEVTLLAPGGDDSITRSIPHTLTMSGAPSQMSLGEAQRRLEELMGCSGEWARLSLRAGRYFGLEEEKQKAVLFDLLGLHITDEFVQKALAEKEERCGLPLVATARGILKGPVNANFGRCHDRFYKERTGVNKSIKSGEERLKAELEKEKEVDGAEPRVARFEPPAAELVEQVQKDLAAVQTAEARRDSAVKAVQRAKNDAERLRQDIARIEQELQEKPDAARVQADIDAGDELLRQLRADKKTAEEKQQARGDALKTGRELKAQLAALEAAIAGAGTCPFRAGHPCKSSADQVPGLKVEHKRLWGEVEAILPAAQVPDQADEIRQLSMRIQKGEAYVKGARQALADAEAWGRKEGELEAKRQELAQAEQRVQEMESELATHPATEALAAQRAEVLKRKQDLDQKTQWAREWSEHVGAMNAYRTQVAEGEKTREVLNTLLDFFGPDGMQREVLAAKIEPIQTELNCILERWGMACAYEIPTAELKVRPRATSPFLPYHRLCDGEQIMVALAHQIVFGVLTKFRIAVLDRFEALDRDNQEKLVRAALDTQDLLDHLILLGVSIRFTPPSELGVFDFRLPRKAA